MSAVTMIVGRPSGKNTAIKALAAEPVPICTYPMMPDAP